MKKLLAKIRKLLRDRRTRQILTRFVSITAAIVVFVTTYAVTRLFTVPSDCKNTAN